MSAPVAPENVVPDSGTPERAPLVPPVNPPATIAEAAQRARELIATGQMGPTDELPPEAPPVVEGASGATGEPVVPPAEEAPPVDEAPPAEPEALPPESDTVVYTPPLDGRPDGEPFVIEVGDKQVGDHLRMLTRGYLRGEQARQAMDQAHAVRAEAEDLTYAVQLDPAGYVTNALQSDEDVDHLFRYLATRPGVLERASDWVQEVMSDQRELDRERKALEAERVTRRDALYREVTERREADQNARAVTRAIGKSIETLAPEGWNDAAREVFFDDIVSDLKRFAREKGLTRLDPRIVPGAIQHRLSLMGIKPRGEAPAPSAPPAPTGAPAAGGTKSPSASPPVTPQQVLQQSARRAAAASAPPGAGSPVPTMPKPPAYDPKAKGSPIQQAAAFARGLIRTRSQRPA